MAGADAARAARQAATADGMSVKEWVQDGAGSSVPPATTFITATASATATKAASGTTGDL
jgi:hypothetical protein